MKCPTCNKPKDSDACRWCEWRAKNKAVSERQRVIRAANQSGAAGTSPLTLIGQTCGICGRVACGVEHKITSVSLPTALALDKACLEDTKALIPASDIPGIRAQIAEALARPIGKDVDGASHRRLAQLAAALAEALNL